MRLDRRFVEADLRIATGLVDFVLPAARLPQQLLAYWQDNYVTLEEIEQLEAAGRVTYEADYEIPEHEGSTYHAWITLAVDGNDIWSVIAPECDEAGFADAPGIEIDDDLRNHLLTIYEGNKRTLAEDWAANVAEHLIRSAETAGAKGYYKLWRSVSIERRTSGNAIDISDPIYAWSNAEEKQWLLDQAGSGQWDVEARKMTRDEVAEELMHGISSDFIFSDTFYRSHCIEISWVGEENE